MSSEVKFYSEHLGALSSVPPYTVFSMRSTLFLTGSNTPLANAVHAALRAQVVCNLPLGYS